MLSLLTWILSLLLDDAKVRATTRRIILVHRSVAKVCEDSGPFPPIGRGATALQAFMTNV